jgi:hypothetical protein
MATSTNNAADQAVANGVSLDEHANHNIPKNNGALCSHCQIAVNHSRSLRSVLLNPGRRSKDAEYAAYSELNPDASVIEHFIAFREVEADLAVNDNDPLSDAALAGMIKLRARLLAGMTVTSAHDLADCIIKATTARDILAGDKHSDPEVRQLISALIDDLDRLHEAA